MAEKFKRGDVLTRTVTGGLVTHYGICTGFDVVIHLLDDGIHKDSLEGFAEGKKVSKKKISNAYSPDEIAEKAEYLYNNSGKWRKYNALGNNCEHFVTFCATGEATSIQAATASVTAMNTLIFCRIFCHIFRNYSPFLNFIIIFLSLILILIPLLPYLLNITKPSTAVPIVHK